MPAARRALLTAIAAAMLPRPTLGQDTWPTRPIRLVVPFAAGTTVDTLARRLNGPLGDVLGQPVVVDNRGGPAATLARPRSRARPRTATPCCSARSARMG
jgi:tripartite-type tricarboxylate transporter receptor subunit TctC